jgi:MFS family permease
LVFLVKDYGGNGFIYGLMGATYPFFQIIGGPLLGKWSDRFGRKRLLLASHAGTVFSWAVLLSALFLPVEEWLQIQHPITGSFVITLPLVILFLARALDGLTGGNISIAYAYLGDISNDQNRKANFGKMSSASNLGFIMGPAIAGSLASLREDFMLPVLFALGISLGGLLIIQYWLPESNPEKEETSENEDQPVKKSIFRIRYVKYMFLLYFLIYLGFNFFYTAFPVHASDGLQWTEARLGYFLSALSILMFLVQGPLMSRFSDKFKEYALILSGSLLLSINFFMLTSSNEWLTYSSILFFALGNGIMWPSYLALLSTIGNKKTQGSIQGTGASFGSFASIVGLIAGGFLYTQIGAYTFAIAGSIFIIVFLSGFYLIKIHNTSKK